MWVARGPFGGVLRLRKCFCRENTACRLSKLQSKFRTVPVNKCRAQLIWFQGELCETLFLSPPPPQSPQINRLQQQFIEKKLTWNPKRLKLNQKDATRSPAWANEAPKTAVCKQISIFHDLWTPLGARLRQICWKKVDLGSHLGVQIEYKCNLKSMWESMSEDYWKFLPKWP